jgi:MraZ protein
MAAQKKEKQRIVYKSSFRHGLDDKRRVQIPAPWRPDEMGVEFTLVLWPKEKEGTCLRVLPPEEMEKFMKTIEAMPNTDPRKAVLRRFIGAESAPVTIDSSGRICIPESFARGADIRNEVVLAGRLESFEIWNPQRYEAKRAADQSLLSDALRELD